MKVPFVKIGPGRESLPKILFWGGIPVWTIILVFLTTKGSGTFRFWDWSPGDWQAIATGLTGWALAIIATMAWSIQAKQAEDQTARDAAQAAREAEAEARRLAQEQLDNRESLQELLSEYGLVFSYGHFAMTGAYGIKEGSHNIMAVTDGGGAGVLDIMWGIDYADTNYHVSFSIECAILSKSVGGISIQTYVPEDMEVEVFAIGLPTPN